MKGNTKTTEVTHEQYIEHEVKLRIHGERFRILENKLNLLISLVLSGWILPMMLHSLKLV